jgi:hypothetical protein
MKAVPAGIVEKPAAGSTHGRRCLGVRGRGMESCMARIAKRQLGIYWPCIVRIWQREPKHRHGQSTQEASQVPALVNPEPLQKGKAGGYFTYPQHRAADPAKYTHVRNT